MSDSQSSLSNRRHPPDTKNLTSSNGMTMVNKPNNVQMPPFALHNYSSESSLVNGHPSSQGSHSNSSSRHHSPTPYACHSDAQVGNLMKLSGLCLNSDRNPPVGSFQRNNFQDQSQFSVNSNRECLTKPEVVNAPYQPAGIPNIQSSPNLESYNFINRHNKNLNASIPTPLFSNNLSSSDTNLANGRSYLPGKHINNKEASSGNSFTNKCSIDEPHLLQSASLSSLDRSTPPNFASPSLQANTSKLFPSKELTSGNIVQKSSPRSSPLTTASGRTSSFPVITQLPCSDSQRPLSSPLLSKDSNNHVGNEPTILKNETGLFSKPPSAPTSSTLSSLGTNTLVSNPSVSVDGIPSRATFEHPSSSVLRPPPSPRPPAQSMMRPPSSLINSPSVPMTGPINNFPSNNSQPMMQSKGPSLQTATFANSPHMLSDQPQPGIGPRLVQATQSSVFKPPPVSPQLYMTGQSFLPMKCPPSATMMGPSPTSFVGQSQTATISPLPTSLMGPSPTSIIGPPTTSIIGPPSTTIMGIPPTSIMRPPQTSIMGPPATSIVGPPPTSIVGPPPTSIVGPPHSSLRGHSPAPIMGHPPMPNMGPPLTSTMGTSSTFTMGTPSTSMIGHAATPMIGPPPLSMAKSPMGLSTSSAMVQPSNINSFQFSPILQPSGLSSHSISNVKFPPSSMNRPLSNTVLSPPPTSMIGPPSSLSAASSAGVLSSNVLQSPVSSSRYPGNPPPQSSQGNQLSQQLGGLSVTREGWNKSWGTNVVDLLQQKTVIPPQGVVPPKPILLQDYLPNCSPDIFRCTISKVPETQSILQKSRLPFGIVIHPFKDLEHLAVVSCNTIVRCRSCRTYINPFVVFKGERRWECNLCFRVNDLPDEFQFDPLTRTYGDPSRRPEVREATIEFIAPQEYMLRPPQPATYIWVLDVSRQAVETGYLKVVCDTLLNCLDKIPGDRRALIGFITFSTTVQFYLMGEGQKEVQMLDVGEIDDIFIPSPDDLLVHLDDSRHLIEELLTSLPETHNNNVFTQTAFGAALTAAHKLLAPIGGRITAMAVTLPTIGPGALKPREDPNQRSAKNISHLGPATDFYKKLALDCSGQQIAVDLFTLNSQYIDLATLSGVSRFSGGCMHHFPGFNVSRNPASVEPFKSCLTRYITRKIGFEAVMRIRTTRGLDITNFHGNFFVRSTDLLSLPNINPDSGFGMQLSIEEPLHNIRQACFQAALLYTSSKGERRIRVHTLCLPVCPNIHEVIAAGDQQAIVDLLAKMAVDRCLSSQMSDAREAIVNTCSDIITAYKASLSTSTAGLPMPASLQALPLYLLGLLKSVDGWLSQIRLWLTDFQNYCNTLEVSLRHGISTKLDDRVFAMFELKTLPLKYLIQSIYPDLYAISYLSETGAINIDDLDIPQPDHLQLSGEYIDRDGAYLMDVGSFIYVYVRSGIASEWVNDVLGVPSFAAIPQPLYEDPFPVLDNPTSELVRNFIFYLQRNKPYYVPVYVIREDNPSRNLFIQYLIDDRSEGTHSYVEFLQFIKSLIK